MVMTRRMWATHLWLFACPRFTAARATKPPIE